MCVSVYIQIYTSKMMKMEKKILIVQIAFIFVIGYVFRVGTSKKSLKYPGICVLWGNLGMDIISKNNIKTNILELNFLRYLCIKFCAFLKMTNP